MSDLYVIVYPLYSNTSSDKLIFKMVEWLCIFFKGCNKGHWQRELKVWVFNHLYFKKHASCSYPKKFELPSTSASGIRVNVGSRAREDNLLTFIMLYKVAEDCTRIFISFWFQMFHDFTLMYNLVLLMKLSSELKLETSETLLKKSSKVWLKTWFVRTYTIICEKLRLIFECLVQHIITAN